MPDAVLVCLGQANSVCITHNMANIIRKHCINNHYSQILLIVPLLASAVLVQSIGCGINDKSGDAAVLVPGCSDSFLQA